MSEEILLNAEWKCYDASGNQIGGSLREIDALQLNKSNGKIEKGITMKLDDSYVAKGVSSDRTTLDMFSKLPDDGEELRNFVNSQNIGLSSNQTIKIETAKISFIELSTGKTVSLTPSQFKNYFNNDIVFSNFNIEGLTPRNLGVTKQELLEGALQLIRKNL